MADDKQAEILRKGRIGWNLLRADDPEWKIDLSGADLRGLNLAGTDLHKLNLAGVDFSGSNLGGVDLHEAELRDANLIGASLRRAYLAGADFNEAFVGWTTFADVDLSQVKGLDAVRHWGPSTIGIDCIHLSQGEIPEIFLRGAGVPETFITYIRSLVASPIDFYSCFISYSSKDDEFAQRLHADLQSKQVRCWFAPEDLKIGDRFRDRIEESIRLHDKLLLVLSANSINSPWVQTEVEAALERERREQRSVLFPIGLDDAVEQTTQAWAADLRRTRHIGDFSHWKNHDSYQAGLTRLLRDLSQSEKK
jgi:hypothetical protein